MDDKKVYKLEELLCLNDTKQILSSKAIDINKNFYHYTTIDSINNILTCNERGERFFFVGNISQMNDRNEAELHTLDGNKIFSFCTCCTNTEKIPLWYLYSGICGNGVRVGFTSGKMLRFINSINIVYPVENGNVNYYLPLKVNTDFELHCGWVFYLEHGSNRVLYKNDFYEVENIDKKSIEYNFFVKDYPWEYEREFRIVIKLKKDNKYEKIAIPLTEAIIKSFELMSAPEYNFTDDEMKKYISLGIKANKIKKSKLKINMGLLYKNRTQIINYIDKWCKDEHCKHICMFVRSKKKCFNKEEK